VTPYEIADLWLVLDMHREEDGLYPIQALEPSREAARQQARKLNRKDEYFGDD
jgi:hypothetical protein